MQHNAITSGDAPTTPGWQLAYVLPNLTIDTGQPFEAAHIAIVPPDDPRLDRIREGGGHSAVLLASFWESRRNPIDPAALIVQNDAPQPIREGVAPIVAFRNAVALSAIPLAWANARPGYADGPLYAEFFDFYPIGIGRTGMLLTDTPALLSPSTATSPSLLAMPSAALPRLRQHISTDRYLLRALKAQWERRFVRPAVNEGYTRALFRSLEMANQAATLPFRNQAQANDYGVATGMWVSACEILAHPDPTAHRPARPRHHRPRAPKPPPFAEVNWPAVVSLLGEVVWDDRRLDRTRGSRKHGTTIYNLNLVQYLYLRLYDARNDFLHSNAIGSRTMRVWPHGHAMRPPITVLAPVIYRTALYAYLTRRVKPATGDFMEDMMHMIEQDQYRDCLLQLVGTVREDN